MCIGQLHIISIQVWIIHAFLKYYVESSNVDGMYIAANIIFPVQTPFFLHSLATSRCAVNDLFAYSSCTQHSCLLVAASWRWRCNSVRNEKDLSPNFGNICGRGHIPVRSSSVKKWGVWIGSSPAPTVLCPTQCKNWNGLHKSSYCYRVSYVGTRNCNLAYLNMLVFQLIQFSWVFVIQTTLGT